MTLIPPADTLTVADYPSRLPSLRLIRFVRFLRTEGFAVGVQETLDTLRVAELCGADLPSLRLGLRSLLCLSRDDWCRFEPLFEQFWFPHRYAQLRETARKRDPRIPQKTRVGGLVGLSHTVDTDVLTRDADTDDDYESRGAGRQTALARSDFDFLTERSAMQEMERLAESLARRLRRHLTRRHRDLNRGRQIHMRRTLRKNMAYGGLPLRLCYRSRRRQFPRFVLLLDVSHSMAQYSQLLARFVRGLVLTFPDAEAFLFHTRLYRVTHLFRQTDHETLRRRLKEIAPLWMGGTRIADSLKNFNQTYRPSIVNSRSIVVVLSDGFDSDAPELLADEVCLLREKARKVLWLNPLLGRSNYSPDDGVITAVLPMLDLLAPAHSVASLNEVVSYLVTL